MPVCKCRQTIHSILFCTVASGTRSDDVDHKIYVPCHWLNRFFVENQPNRVTSLSDVTFMFSPLRSIGGEFLSVTCAITRWYKWQFVETRIELVTSHGSTSACSATSPHRSRDPTQIWASSAPRYLVVSRISDSFCHRVSTTARRSHSAKFIHATWRRHRRQSSTRLKSGCRAPTSWGVSTGCTNGRWTTCTPMSGSLETTLRTPTNRLELVVMQQVGGILHHSFAIDNWQYMCMNSLFCHSAINC